MRRQIRCHVSVIARLVLCAVFSPQRPPEQTWRHLSNIQPRVATIFAVPVVSRMISLLLNMLHGWAGDLLRRKGPRQWLWYLMSVRARVGQDRLDIAIHCVRRIASIGLALFLAKALGNIGTKSTMLCSWNLFREHIYDYSKLNF